MYSQTKIDVTSLEAFFCKTEDLVDFGFALAEKRDVL